MSFAVRKNIYRQIVELSQQARPKSDTESHSATWFCSQSSYSVSPALTRNIILQQDIYFNVV